MTCQYCSAQNTAEDHRCGRCGRRLNDTPHRSMMFPVQRSSAAPVVHSYTDPQQPPAVAPPAGPRLVTEQSPASESREPSIQASLFGPQQVAPAASAAAAPAQKRQSMPRPEKSAREQQLSFSAAFESRTAARETVYGNATVAIASARVIAAAVDCSMSLLLAGIFLGTLYFAGDPLLLTTPAKISYGLAAALIALFYRVLFCIGNRDTWGVECAGLRLVNFDGRRPSRRQRLHRIAGGCLSAVSAGIGLIWAMVDEDRLTWHDHISKTYPAPRSW